MTLFDPAQPLDDSWARYCEPRYSFLNRSSKIETAEARVRLESWFARYPKEHQDNLQKRFRLSLDEQHQSAFFELLLHELLVCLGHAVFVEPEKSDSTRVPDFLASYDQKDFRLEAAVVTGVSDADRAAQNRINAVYDALDKFDSPDYFFGLMVTGAPQTSPPAKEIVRFLRERLLTVELDSIRAIWSAAKDLDSLPHWVYEREGWTIEFVPVPKSEALRGKPGVRPMAFKMPAAARVTSCRQDLQKVLKQKAYKYGNHTTPYVIAINLLDMLCGKEDVVDALFGSEVIEVSRTDGKETLRTVRTPDGLWHDHDGPTCTRVSGVLVFFEAIPWVHKAAQLYINPWAERPYEGSLSKLETVRLIDARLQTTEGAPLAEIFEAFHE